LWRLDSYLQREVAKANAAAKGGSAMNFQQSYLYWLAAVLLIVAVMSWQDKATRV
jgi:hypothetical protein